MAVAYLMWKKTIGYSSALALVKAKRSQACPNEGFAAQLQLFERMDCVVDPLHKARELAVPFSPARPVYLIGLLQEYKEYKLRLYAERRASAWLPVAVRCLAHSDGGQTVSWTWRRRC